MPSPPRAPKHPHEDLRHGERLDDPYAWLKDPNWQAVLKEPALLQGEIRAYLEAENAYAAAEMAGTAGVQQRLVAELRGRLKEDDATVPRPDGPYEYFQRFATGGQYPVHVRRRAGGTAADEVVLDVPALAAGRAFCRVFAVLHSPDHAMVAYTVDVQGAERYELRVRALDGGRDLDDVITDAGPDFAWANDGKTLYYTVLDHNHRPKWVKRHVLGTPVAVDPILYEERDPGFFLHLSRATSRRYIVLDAYDHTCSEVHVLAADDPAGAFRLVEARQPGVIYSVGHAGESFYITLHEGAQKDGRIMTAPVAAPARAGWRELVPYRAGRLIEEVGLFRDWLVRLELVDALPRLVVRHLSSGEEHALTFPEAAYHLTLVPGFEFATLSLRFTYSSMATPERTFDYNMGTRTRLLLKEQVVPSGHDPSAYEVVRLSCVARDGEVVPVTLLRHKHLCRPGGPLLLYGYGAYGRAMPTSFSPHRFSLVDRGVAYAIAHVRGGKEKGFAWYESAKVLNKKRTFHDFIDCAEHLAATGVTCRGGIIAHGASAGGMLMGAVVNMAPELFLGVIADVPFVDVLNTMWDHTLPLTPPEWPEWGNPILSAEAHAYIASYSPYDNVGPKAYPHLLVLAGLTDPRVTYWEPAKWVARLRERRLGDKLLLFQVDMDAGHAGASGRFDVLKKTALMYTFALKIAGKGPDA